MTSLVLVRYRADPLFGRIGKICKLLELFRKARTGGPSHQYAPMARRAPAQHVIAYDYSPLKPVIQTFE